MRRISENRIADYNYLDNLLNNYKGILTHEIIDYLYSLLKLEVSVFNADIDINKELVLSDLKLFRDIAAYNIYFKAKRYIPDYKLYKVEDTPFYNGLNIYSIKNKNEKVFGFSYDITNCCNVTLYDEKVKSVYQRSLDIKKELQATNEKLKGIRRSSINYEILKEKIEWLENVSYEELQCDYQKELEVAKPKSIILNNALLDYNLNKDIDFKDEDGCLVRKNSFSKIMIKK